VAVDIPNRHDRQSLLSTLRRVVPRASPRVTLRRVLSTPFIGTDKPIGKEWLAVTVASELLLQSKSPIYAASGACFYHRNDQKAQLQFFEMSAEECQKHITLDENANKYETKTMAVVSLVFSTTSPGWLQRHAKFEPLRICKKSCLALLRTQIWRKAP
jgi:hypothetical protein